MMTIARYLTREKANEQWSSCNFHGQGHRYSVCVCVCVCLLLDTNYPYRPNLDQPLCNDTILELLRIN